MPQIQRPTQRLPSFKQLTFSRENSAFRESNRVDTNREEHASNSESDTDDCASASGRLTSLGPDFPVGNLIANFASRETKTRVTDSVELAPPVHGAKSLSKDKMKLIKNLGKGTGRRDILDEYDDIQESGESRNVTKSSTTALNDFDDPIADREAEAFRSACGSRTSSEHCEEEMQSKPQVKASQDSLQYAFDRMRPRQHSPEIATIEIGEKTTSSALGSSMYKKRKSNATSESLSATKSIDQASTTPRFSSFAAPGSQLLRTVGAPRSKSRVARIQYDKPSHEDSTVSIYLSDTAASPSESPGSSCEDGRRKDSSMGNEDVPVNNVDAVSIASSSDFDDVYLDDAEKKIQEEARVANLITQAESAAALPSQDNKRRAQQVLKGGGQKDWTNDLTQYIDLSMEQINLRSTHSCAAPAPADSQASTLPTTVPSPDTTPEDCLTLIINKDDFGSMNIVGQFNLGFILSTRADNELFIIDQHASDEKINFERLQATTVMQSQRLVHPINLELTAVEEELVLENQDALDKNGFQIDVDLSGESLVGRRCRLISLPMSKEVTFDTSDLEELIALFAESRSSSGNIPRPGKTRRLFAMRACRSSVMIGKTLTIQQMEKQVRRMGEIDKPWNCPHGRPTMRHICGLDGFAKVWGEGDGILGLEAERAQVDWSQWMATSQDILQRQRDGFKSFEDENGSLQETPAEMREGLGEVELDSGEDE